jgi:hypothetical protein
VPPSDVLKRMRLNLYKIDRVAAPPVHSKGKNLLTMMPPPPLKPAKGASTTPPPMGNKNPNYAKRDAQNRKLGRAGELLVLDYEREHLTHAGKGDLAKLVSHVAVAEGDNAGYDIRRFIRMDG